MATNLTQREQELISIKKVQCCEFLVVIWSLLGFKFSCMDIMLPATFWKSAFWFQC